MTNSVDALVPLCCWAGQEQTLEWVVDDLRRHDNHVTCTCISHNICIRLCCASFVVVLSSVSCVIYLLAFGRSFHWH